MINISQKMTDIHSPMDRALFRALFFIAVVFHISMFMWEPKSYANEVGGFNLWITVLFTWSLCSALIYSVGFKPILWVWQILFSPYWSGIILTYFTWMYFLHN
ncbi:cytochrome bd biosynthesis protein [Vibrio rumoiensis 1S-45]|uniref:Cytochrome bd biosynthesis protein n=2 Tax=Vibrio rumoiensis TaxID=76258 RepID=A0A1E5E1B5_9VIBR|nr:cytochrome bd biosynthesis protein [Vibrio rumoiensis 1S-45]